MRRTKRVLAGVLSVLLLVQTTGCTTWNTVAQPWPEAVAKYPAKRIRVALVDGPTITADSVRIVADTLLVVLPNWQVAAKKSFQDSWPGRFLDGQSIDTVPLARVQAVKVNQVSTGKTVGLFMGIAVVVLSPWIYLTIYCAGYPKGGCF